MTFSLSYLNGLLKGYLFMQGMVELAAKDVLWSKSCSWKLANFTWKHLCWIVGLQSLRPATLLKRDSKVSKKLLTEKARRNKQPQLEKLKRIPTTELITLALICFFTIISVKRCKIKLKWHIKMKIKIQWRSRNKNYRTKTII